jgi:hypothetical protein
MPVIYTKNTPSLRKKKKRMTKNEWLELIKYNKQRKTQGMKPVTSLAFPKLDMSTVVPVHKLPTYDYSWRRGDNTRSIPSSTSVGGADATAKKSIMDVVHSKDESDETKAEIIRKSTNIAPHYSKGAYQYVGDAIDIVTDLGRKK